MEESVRLDQLNYFVEVAKSGSINHAAQRLFATQQTVNAALKRLEKELGYTLLVRSASGVTQEVRSSSMSAPSCFKKSGLVITAA